MSLIVENRSASLSYYNWLNLGLVAIILSVPMVLFVQAIALVVWPDIKSFDPLNSLMRSALFTAVPVAGATLVFAFLAGRMAEPGKLFTKIALAVLVVSLIPDYLLPLANKTLLASSVAAFLHVIAALISIVVLQQGYKQLRHRA